MFSQGGNPVKRGGGSCPSQKDGRLPSENGYWCQRWTRRLEEVYFTFLSVLPALESPLRSHSLQFQRLPEFDHLVAQGGRAFELQLLGRFLHLFFERGDLLDQLIRG